jgi:hypothetical protein
MTIRPKSTQCKHPPVSQFTWWAYNCQTGKNDILCVGCCACGEILKGAAGQSPA